MVRLIQDVLLREAPDPWQFRKMVCNNTQLLTDLVFRSTDLTSRRAAAQTGLLNLTCLCGSVRTKEICRLKQTQQTLDFKRLVTLKD